jgi:hypothetical protein
MRDFDQREDLAWNAERTAGASGHRSKVLVTTCIGLLLMFLAYGAGAVTQAAMSAPEEIRSEPPSARPCGGANR